MVEDVLRPIRLGMAGAGISVEDSKGECNFGQHEVNFRYSDALAMADNHSVYKNGAKEIAYLHGCALSFMAKYDEREGNSCHIHVSLWDERGSLSPGDGRARPQHACSSTSSPASWPSTRELAYFFAPNVNSYKRYAWGSFAPTTLVWGIDNRTCGFRVVGHGAGLRLESRIAGRRRQPVPGVRRDDRRRPARHRQRARARARLPGQRLRRRRQAAAAGQPARGDRAARGLERSRATAFGDDVVDHYLHYARTEQRAFEAAVTDWERFRSFERM